MKKIILIIIGIRAIAIAAISKVPGCLYGESVLVGQGTKGYGG